MIKFRRVSKVYQGNIYALDDVTVDIEKKEFVFIVGPSGSGKSTFIKLLLKEEEPTSGQVYIADTNLSDIKKWKIPYLQAQGRLRFPGLQAPAAEDHLRERGLRPRGDRAGRRRIVESYVPEVLRLVGLSPQARFLPGRAVGRRAAARVHRAGVREPAADTAGRRADREPRPVDVDGHRQAAREDQQHRYHCDNGHPRPGHREHVQEEGGRAARR